jgi:hypothetical protein
MAIETYFTATSSCLSCHEMANIVAKSVPGFQSKALDDLRTTANAAQGLTVRYCVYDAIFNIDAATLHDKFTKGEYVTNPYRGQFLGTIGVWGDSEMATAPPGRKLQIQVPYTFTTPPPVHTEVALDAKKKAMASVPTYRSRRKTVQVTAAPTKQATLGVALAHVDKAKSQVSLDCISTFPESKPRSGDKFDLGPMNLVLLYGDDRSVHVGPIAYNSGPDYQATGGMIEVSYVSNPQRGVIAANIDFGRLAIYQEISQTYLLTERPGASVLTDQRAVYFDAKVKMGPTAVASTAEVAIQVFDRGVPPRTPTVLNLEYWMCQKNYVNPDKPQMPVTDRYIQVDGAKPIAPTKYASPFVGGPPEPVEVITDQVTVPSGGRLTLHLTAIRPGTRMIRCVTPNIQPTTPNFAWDNVDYANVRILPFDDYSGFTDEQINNGEFMYEHFFSYFSVLYPVMSKLMPWGPSNAPNNPEEVKTFAANILNFTDAFHWDLTIYMPITREMSGGKRDLLHRWCNLQL